MWKLADNILSWCATPEEDAIQQAKNIYLAEILTKLTPLAVIKG